MLNVSLPSNSDLTSRFAKYFGTLGGGINCLRALREIDADKLVRLLSLVKNVSSSGRGRIFVLGNGGSFDNALSIVNLFLTAGVPAQVPGEPTQYFSSNYNDIFADALKRAKIGQQDLIIGLSGSGNSPNILRAFELGLECGASVFAFGGRDGGKMKMLAGSENTILASTNSMEAIEDAHYAVGIWISSAIKNAVNILDVKASFIDALAKCFDAGEKSESNLSLLGQLGESVLKTIFNQSTLYILGSGIGSRHFRADAGRGFSNGVPLRGVNAPEIFTVNSGMATCNDDGPAFILVDGLAKFSPSEKDFAILMNLDSPSELATNTCMELLKESGTPFLTIGRSSGSQCIDFSAFLTKFDPEFVPAIVGHACGTVVREILQDVFAVRPLIGVSEKIDFREQRKISLSETLELEKELRAERVITEQEVITFAYGNAFAAKDPKCLGLQRGHY